MFIVLETSNDNGTVVKGVHRQIKPASVQAWTLYLKSKTDPEIVKVYCEKGTKINHGPTYKILCWDERPNENALIGTWFLETPPLSLGKDQTKKEEVFVARLNGYLDELKTGRTPSILWNSYMRHEKETEDAETAK